MKHVNNTIFQSVYGLLFLLLPTATVLAQTPTVFASGFSLGLNGLTRDAQGNLWVAETGTGTNNGRISVITPAGAVHTAVSGLPSIITDSMTMEAAGPWIAYRRGDQLHVLTAVDPLSLGGALLSYEIPGYTPGDAPLTFADADDRISISPFVLGAGFMESNPYRATWLPNGDPLIVDAAANSVLRYHVAGDSFSVLHTFPPIQNTFTPFPPFIDYVPTSIVSDGAGDFYVGNLTGFPFLPGLASVVSMELGGNVTPFATGLSQIVELQVDSASGDVYALQFAQFDSTFSPAFGSARITRITPGGVQTTVAAGFGPSTGMALDGAGGAYVTSLFTGQVLHISGVTAAHEAAVTKIDAVQLSPNPTAGPTVLSFELREAADVRYTVYNVQGRALRQAALGRFSAGRQSVALDLSGLPGGVYMIGLHDGAGFRACRAVLTAAR